MSKKRIQRERGEQNMCKKIQEVNLLTPDLILKKYWDKKIPVDIKQILKNVGVHFREYDMSGLSEALGLESDDAILGMAFAQGDDLGILCSNRIDKNRTNYIFAHEFAHCCLHLHPSEEFHVEMKVSQDVYSKAQSKIPLLTYFKSKKEIQADKFAADLLIPTDALFEFLANGQKHGIEDIAAHFHVSSEIVRLKIINLRRYKIGEA